MSWDIHGNPLARGHCEVHPWIAEGYPCSACVAEDRRRDSDREAWEWEQRAQAAEATVARVRAVHANAGDGWCLGCDADWPCATWDALRGEPS